MQKTHYPVTPIAQACDIKPYVWKRRSCGIASLFMVMRYYKKSLRVNLLQTLIDQGVKRGAYLPGIGWTHQGLIDLAKTYEFTGERFDYTHNKPQESITALLDHIKQGPIIASIHKDFKQKNGGHLIVLNGYDVDAMGVTFHIVDPKSKKKKRAIKTIPEAIFMQGWKKRCIVIRPIATNTIY